MRRHQNVDRGVHVPPRHLKHCFVKARFANDLTLEEAESLVNWCGYQDGNLWEGMTLQEILNVYRVSGEWEDFQSWAQEEGNVARRKWNAVVRPKNRLRMVKGE